MRIQRLVGHAKPTGPQDSFDAVLVQHVARWQGIGPAGAALGRRGRLGNIRTHMANQGWWETDR